MYKWNVVTRLKEIKIRYQKIFVCRLAVNKGENLSKLELFQIRPKKSRISSRYFAAKTYHKTDECLTPLFIRLKFVVIPKSADSLCFDKISELFTLLKLIFGFRKLQGAEIYPQF